VFFLLLSVYTEVNSATDFREIEPDPVFCAAEASFTSIVSYRVSVATPHAQSLGRVRAGEAILLQIDWRQ
jgi:hypothetical protein